MIWLFFGLQNDVLIDKKKPESFDSGFKNIY